LLTVVGAIGLLGLRSVTTASTGFIEREFVASDAMGDLRAEMISLRRHEKDILINLGNAEAMQKYLASWKESNKVMRSKLAQMDTLGASLGIAQPLTALHGALDEYESVFSKVSATAIAGGYESTLAANKAMGDAKAAFHNAEKLSKAANDTLNERAIASAQDVTATSASSTRWVCGAWIAGILVGAGFGW